MLKTKSEMLEIIKISKFPEKFSGNFPNPENFRDPGDSWEIFEKFPVSRKLKIREKGKPLSQQNSLHKFGFDNFNQILRKNATSIS